MKYEVIHPDGRRELVEWRYNVRIMREWRFRAWMLVAAIVGAVLATVLLSGCDKSAVQIGSEVGPAVQAGSTSQPAVQVGSTTQPVVYVAPPEIDMAANGEVSQGHSEQAGGEGKQGDVGHDAWQFLVNLNGSGWPLVAAGALAVLCYVLLLRSRSKAQAGVKVVQAIDAAKVRGVVDFKDGRTIATLNRTMGKAGKQLVDKVQKAK